MLSLPISMHDQAKSVPKRGMGLKYVLDIYSRTSINGHSEKRTTSVERTNKKVPIDFSITSAI